MALRTVDLNNIQQVSLELSYRTFSETVHQGWLDLDSLLVQFRTSRSLRLKVMHTLTRKRDRREGVARLLPEVMRRGVADLVGCTYTIQQFPGFPTLI
jgi:hypothetical protein